jgi:predicted NAD-dependent protein-ADP-ribosyltransferase YbiA (DUF1768 family)
MDRASYFILNKALFGSFPDQQSVKHLEEIGVRYFIDLTNHNETKTIPYTTNYNYLKYPILDRKIPEDWCSFAALIVRLCDLLKRTDGKLYIHCKGGHGRSGIVVACVLCYYFKMNPEEALKKTNEFHNDRKEMKEKWRKIGSPQSKRQKDFVHRFFRSLKYTSSYNDINFPFSNNSDHQVTIPEVGTFPNAYFAYQYYKSPDDSRYTENLKNRISNNSDIIDEWEDRKINYMYNILKLKFTQHIELKNMLLNSGLRPLCKISIDKFWGDGFDGTGLNHHGKLLQKIRREMLYLLPQHDEP